MYLDQRHNAIHEETGECLKDSFEKCVSEQKTYYLQFTFPELDQNIIYICNKVKYESTGLQESTAVKNIEFPADAFHMVTQVRIFSTFFGI